MSQYENESDFIPFGGKKFIKVSAPVAINLHTAASWIYSLQGTKMSKRVETLIRGDLKRTMRRKWFKELPLKERMILESLVSTRMKKD